MIAAPIHPQHPFRPISHHPSSVMRRRLRAATVLMAMGVCFSMLLVDVCVVIIGVALGLRVGRAKEPFTHSTPSHALHQHQHPISHNRIHHNQVDSHPIVNSSLISSPVQTAH